MLQCERRNLLEETANRVPDEGRRLTRTDLKHWWNQEGNRLGTYWITQAEYRRRSTVMPLRAFLVPRSNDDHSASIRQTRPEQSNVGPPSQPPNFRL